MLLPTHFHMFVLEVKVQYVKSGNKNQTLGTHAGFEINTLKIQLIIRSL